MSEFLIALGATVKSNISGFKGVAIARSEHMNGCNRYWVAPKVGKDNKLPEGNWIDEHELVVIAKPKGRHVPDDPGGFASPIK
jgi:hypothetical protein